ncbi:hypothetical protein NDK47_19000 [Brevibacillus ruminantium]|uniref:Lipoprotein n=1 Tax=Brevibacillus ruminantium TaxID=2950604 RepID=A0ABY4WBL9_9BACL|nr:hypothetical protein [Brevibacillus ruminantium]USG64231.1 hypothetical protein NDK47_19000 [Brevibacillus ruminantium]
MKKVIGTLTVTILGAAVLFSGFSNTEASDVPISTDIQNKWEIYAQNEISKKLSETHEDAIQDFQIDESQYTYQSLYDKEFQGLGKDDSNRLFISVFNSVLVNQKQGDFVPGLLLKNDLSEAIVVYKSLESGDNHLYVFTRDGKEWTLIKEDVQKGKKMEKVTYKNLQQFNAEYKC